MKKLLIFSFLLVMAVSLQESSQTYSQTTSHVPPPPQIGDRYGTFDELQAPQINTIQNVPASPKVKKRERNSFFSKLWNWFVNIW